MVDYRYLAIADVLKRYRGKRTLWKRLICRYFVVPRLIVLVSYQPNIKEPVSDNIMVRDTEGKLYSTPASVWEWPTVKERTYYRKNIYGVMNKD